MILEVCPSCDIQDSVFLTLPPAIRLDGTLFGMRIEGFCNNTQCDQRYWYFPQSARVTRRNTGNTYAEWERQRSDLSTINASRKRVGRPMLIESSVYIGPEPPSLNVPRLYDVDESGPEGITIIPALPSRFRQYVYERWCWVRAFFVVYVPGFGRFSVSDDQETS